MFTTWREAEESFDEQLDNGGAVEIAGLDFWPSTILKECDPIAYRCYLYDFIDGEGVDSDDLEGEPRDH